MGNKSPAGAGLKDSHPSGFCFVAVSQETEHVVRPSVIMTIPAGTSSPRLGHPRWILGERKGGLRRKNTWARQMFLLEPASKFLQDGYAPSAGALTAS